MLAQRDLLRNWTRTRAYKNDVQRLPKELDAKVAKLHFPALGAELSAIQVSRRQEPSMAKNCCPSGSSSAGRLRQEPSITKNCWTSSSSSARIADGGPTSGRGLFSLFLLARPLLCGSLIGHVGGIAVWTLLGTTVVTL